MTQTPTPYAIRLVRLIRVGLHVLQGVIIAGAVLRFAHEPLRSRIIQSWSQKLLAIFSVEYQVYGPMPDLSTRGAVFVANHVSWLDIWLIYTLRPVRFISKADVRAWPVIGWLAEKTGTLFIHRERRHHTAAIIKQAEAALAQGDCIGLFPEGTTTDGLRLLPFHASLFQAAVAQQAPIVLIAIRYRLPDGGIDTAPAYYGDLSLADSLRAVLARRRIRVEATYLGTLASVGKTRRELSRAAETTIAKALNLPAPHKAPEIPAGLRDAAPTTPLPTDSPYPKPHGGSPH